MKYLLLVLFMPLLTSCHKNSDEPDKVKSRSELLLNKKWVVVSEIGTESDGTVIDGFAGVQESQKDDYIVFYADMTYEVNDNLKKRPDVTGQIINTGTWQLLNNDSILEYRGNETRPRPHQMKIIQLEETKLQIEDDESGTVVIATYKPIQ